MVVILADCRKSTGVDVLSKMMSSSKSSLGPFSPAPAACIRSGGVVACACLGNGGASIETPVIPA